MINFLLNILFFYKKTINFIKVDILLINSLKKKHILAFVVVLLAIWTLRFINTNEYSTANIQVIQFGFLWISFVLFFKNLKKQNFFKHLIVNRSFYIAELEILAFLASVFIIVITANICFLPFIGLQNGKIFIASIMPLLIDALLFTNWKISKYLFLQFLFLFLIIVLFLLSHYLTINFDNLDVFSDFLNRYYTYLTFIEFCLLKKSITSQ